MNNGTGLPASSEGGRVVLGSQVQATLGHVKQAVELHGPQFPHCTVREKDDRCSFQAAGPLGDRVTAAAASMALKEQTTYQGAQSQQCLLTLGLCPAFLPLSAHPLAGGSFIPSHVY